MDFAEIIEKVGDEVVRQDLSENAMENITTLQIKAMDILPEGFVLTQGKFDKIKKRAARRLRSHNRNKVCLAVGEEIEILLNVNHPSAILDHREENGKPVIEIWYEGKPPIEKV